MKRWIQISIVSILLVAVVNISFLNYQMRTRKLDILYTQGRTTQLVEQLVERDCMLYKKLLGNIQDNICEEQIPNLVERLNPTVVCVNVIAKTRHPMTGKEVLTYVNASGMVLDKEGNILTASHVVDSLKGFLSDPNTYWDVKATVQIYSGEIFEIRNFINIPFDISNPESLVSSIDLGILKIDIPDCLELTPVQFGDIRDLRIGRSLLMIGNPGGLTNSISTGVVSRIGKFLGGSQIFIQVDTSVNLGNSGGPIFGLNGKCYGLVSLIYPNGTLGFCVSSSDILENIPKLLEQLAAKQ